MGKRTDKEIWEDISKFIKKNGIMSLATQSPDGPWICTVYYGVDDDLNFYIVTDPDSRHGLYMRKSTKVAFNIFDSHQKIYKDKEGLQGTGTIEVIEGIANIAKALSLWHKQNPGIEKNITVENVKKFKDTKLWKLTPNIIKFFNKKLYYPDDYASWQRK